MFLHLEDKTTHEKRGPIEVNLANPEEKYDLGNGYRVELLSYFPDFFYFDEEGKTEHEKRRCRTTRRLYSKMFTPTTPDGEVSFVAIRQNIEPAGTNKYKNDIRRHRDEKCNCAHCTEGLNTVDSRSWRYYFS
ncbi:hypothetical protein GCM10020331_068350 [Ectobacillus funiculus]